MKIKTQRRTNYLLIIVAALFLAIILSRNLVNTQPKNLILISIDTLRPDHMGVYGYEKNTTPNIDKWAQTGTVFTNAYTQTPSTYPSFVSFMTGKTPFESGVYNTVIARGDHFSDDVVMSEQTGNLPLDNNNRTIAEVLRDKGFSTGAFILNHVLSPEFTNLDKGFDTYQMITQLNSDEPNNDVVGNVTSWLTKHQGKKEPIFLWVHFLDPHSPYMPTEKNKCKFGPEMCSEILSADIDRLENTPGSFHYCMDEPLRQDTIEFYKTLYDGEIADIDEHIGKILQKIIDLGMDKNSMIIIYGDHGESFEKNYYFAHSQQLYESSVKIPLIIYHPFDKRGKKEDRLIKSADLFSLVAEFFNFDEWKNNTENKIDNVEKEPLFFVNASATKYAVRKENYKYIYSTEKDACSKERKRELYDLEKDPEESENIIDDHPEVAAELHNSLMIHLNRYPIIDQEVEIEFEKGYSQESQDQEILEQLKSLGY